MSTSTTPKLPQAVAKPRTRAKPASKSMGTVALLMLLPAGVAIDTSRRAPAGATFSTALDHPRGSGSR